MELTKDDIAEASCVEGVLTFEEVGKMVMLKWGVEEDPEARLEDTYANDERTDDELETEEDMWVALELRVMYFEVSGVVE